jgi:CHASE3 domain sensor protein
MVDTADREATERERQQEQETERAREATRRRIAYILIATLVIVILASFVYIIWGSVKAGNLTIDDLSSMIQTIGTTLLAPLIGLIGAVVGFYYGGQTAVQGAQTATQASTQAAQAAQDVIASQQGTRPPNTGAQGTRPPGTGPQEGPVS